MNLFNLEFEVEVKFNPATDVYVTINNEKYTQEAAFHIALKLQEASLDILRMLESRKLNK